MEEQQEDEHSSVQYSESAQRVCMCGSPMQKGKEVVYFLDCFLKMSTFSYSQQHLHTLNLTFHFYSYLYSEGLYRRGEN